MFEVDDTLIDEILSLISARRTQSLFFSTINERYKFPEELYWTRLLSFTKRVDKLHRVRAKKPQYCAARAEKYENKYFKYTGEKYL